MHVIIVCSNEEDQRSMSQMLNPTQFEPELTGRTVTRLPQRPTAAAAHTGELIGHCDPESQGVIFALLLRSAEIYDIYRISHAICAGDLWFADLMNAGDIPTRALSDSPAAWSFAAACSLLPPESVCGFCAPAKNRGIFENIVAAVRTIHRLLLSANQRYSPQHVQKSRAAAERAAERASFTASQRTLLIRAATEAAVRTGIVPRFPDSSHLTPANRSARNQSAREMIAALQELGNEDS